MSGWENLAPSNNTTAHAQHSLAYEEVQHFLGDPGVLHAFALILGIIAITVTKRFPHALAAVASVTLGLWVGLVIQDRQVFNHPVMSVTLPSGVWVPLLAGFSAAAGAGAFALVTWRLALAALTGGIVMMLVVAICRLANVSPEEVLRVGSNVLSAYRIAGAVVLMIAILGGAFLAKKFHKGMAAFTSAHLGTLLVLSGVSFFAQSAGAAEAPFSLLDDIARIFSEVRSGNCHLWEAEEHRTSLRGCDCGEQCKQEITAWIASSWTVLGMRLLMEWLRRKRLRDKAKEEELAPLKGAGSQEDGHSETASASTIGKLESDRRMILGGMSGMGGVHGRM